MFHIAAYLVLSFQRHIPPGRDAWSYIAAARAFAVGQTPYTSDLSPLLPDAPDAPAPYLYPPLPAVLLIPIASFPLPVALTIWFLVVAVSHGLLIGALRQWVGWRMACLMVLAWLPTWQGLYYGQINALVALCIALALLCYQRDQYRSSAGWLLLGAMLKITPAVTLLLFAVQRRWRALRWSAIGVLVIIALLVPIVDAQLWLRSLLFAMTTTRANPLYSSWGAALGHLPGRAGTIAPLALAVGCITFTLVRGARVPSQLAFAATLLVPLLVARTTWEHHAVLALPAFAILWMWSARARWVAGSAWVVVGVAGAFMIPLALTVCWAACLFPHFIAPQNVCSNAPDLPVLSVVRSNYRRD